MISSSVEVPNNDMMRNYNSSASLAKPLAMFSHHQGYEEFNPYQTAIQYQDTRVYRKYTDSASYQIMTSEQSFRQSQKGFKTNTF